VNHEPEMDIDYGYCVSSKHMHAHSYTHRFMALLDSVQEFPGDPAPER